VRRKKIRFVLLHAVVSSVVLGLVSATLVLAQSSPPVALPDIEVRGTTPLMSSPVAREHIPANVQTITGEQITRRGALNLTDTLSRSLGGVNLNHVQNNPFQPDVSYRGFTSSFLIGTPPGLSVFVDGVRINEPLADQVNWDLIPTDAIDRLELIPGSNPVYGRNTLGGTIVMQTKRGFTHPGTTAEVWGGSFARYRTLLQHGGSRGKFDYFVSGNLFLEDGFRDFSKSHVGHLFGKVGYRGTHDDLSLSLTHVNNKLTGNGPLPESRLKRDRSEVFTHPDIFKPDLWFLNSQYQRDLGRGFSLSANLYGRLLDVDQFNVDVEEDVDARTNQKGWGGALQLAYQGTVWERPVSITIGGDYSGARLDHLIGERGEDDDDGDDNGDDNGDHDDDDNGDDDLEDDLALLQALVEDEADEFEVETSVKTETHSGGPFFTISAEPIDKLTVTVSGRYEVTYLRIQDRLAGLEDDDDDDGAGTDASGNHTFDRFNPAVGATYTFTEHLSLYAGYSESYRAPTAIELTCANPEAPCPVPTAIVDDPPLNAVKGKTWETGVRWALPPYVDATLAFFRTDLKDDILFRNEPESRVLGFFQNVDATRRQGIELLLRGVWSWGNWFLNYTVTDATFNDEIELFTFANEERIALVREGDRLPLVPPHRVNGGIEFFIGSQLRLSLDGAYVDGQRLRGDEANQRSRLDPYFVANVALEYRYKAFDIFLRLENIFDEEYESYGAYFENAVDDTGVERFMGPGQPFGAFGGVRVKF